MQDSLQLPEELDSVHTLLSPAPQVRQSRENTPPHSLAYSNSTCGKDRMQEIQIRSPFAFDQLQADSPGKLGVIKANNQNYPINHQNTFVVSPVKKEEVLENNRDTRDKPAAKGQYKKLKPKVMKDSRSPQKADRLSPNLNQPSIKTSISATQPVRKSEEHFQQRKTLQKSQTGKTNKRIKQLQQALHIQTVLSQELRTKLSVTKSLLESAMKQNGLTYFFNLKNTSRDMKNIDVFIEMTTLQKSLNEKSIYIDRLKDQLKEMNLNLESLKLKKGGSPILRSPNKTLNDQLQKLIEQKESLMSYIEEQKATLKRKLQYISQLEQEVNRIGDKQAHYRNVERPKLITQLSQLKQRNRQLQELVSTMQMQTNLAELKLNAEKQQLRHKIQKLQQTLIRQDRMFEVIEKQSIRTQSKSIQTQKDDLQKSKFIQQLTLLKNQRDYYYAQYQKRTGESAELYALQLKMSLLQQNFQPQP